jgi:hypothetical protein
MQEKKSHAGPYPTTTASLSKIFLLGKIRDAVADAGGARKEK